MNRLPLALALAMCVGSGTVVAKGAGGHDNVRLIAAQAKAAIQAGNYAEAYCAWRPLAEQGDPDGQLALGWMYHKGWGLAIDDERAVEWWRRASEQGHLEATFALGSLYSMGSRAIPRDLEEAVRLWSEAARQGHEDARVALRQLAGRGIPDTEPLFLELLEEKTDVFGEHKMVIADRANVRQGPGTDYRVLAVFERGRPIVELLRRDDWVKVGANKPARIAWIHHTLIGEMEWQAEGGQEGQQ